jgi:hypothetical protein
LLKNVIEAANARQKQVKKRNLCVINEHSKPVFNAAAATQIIFQRLSMKKHENTHTQSPCPPTEGDSGTWVFTPINGR